MEVEKNVRIVYTKEALIDMVVENAAQAGYSVDRKNVKFVDKRGNKSNFKNIVATELTEMPLSEKVEATVEIIKEEMEKRDKLK